MTNLFQCITIEVVVVTALWPLSISYHAEHARP
jgi:hypothetical protein